MKTVSVDGGVCVKGELGGKNGKPGGVLNVSRQRALELRAYPTFPKPAIRTVDGEEIWRVRDLTRWNAARLEKHQEREKQRNGR